MRALLIIFGLGIVFCESDNIHNNEPVPMVGAGCTDRDFDVLILKAHGEKWKQGSCHQCECINGDIICEGPTCALQYKRQFEYTCTRWSGDTCCCEHEGCLVGMEHVDFGKWYTSPTNACESCLCTLGQHKCRISLDCKNGDDEGGVPVPIGNAL